MPSSGNKEGQFDSKILCGLMLNLYGTRGGDTSEASRTEEKSSKIGMSKWGKTSPSSLHNSEMRILLLLLVLRRWTLGGVVIKWPDLLVKNGDMNADSALGKGRLWLSNNAEDSSLNVLLDGVSIDRERDASFCALIENAEEGGARMSSFLSIVIIVGLLVWDWCCWRLCRICSCSFTVLRTKQNSPQNESVALPPQERTYDRWLHLKNDWKDTISSPDREGQLNHKLYSSEISKHIPALVHETHWKESHPFQGTRLPFSYQFINFNYRIKFDVYESARTIRNSVSMMMIDSILSKLHRQPLRVHFSLRLSKDCETIFISSLFSIISFIHRLELGSAVDLKNLHLSLATDLMKILLLIQSNGSLPSPEKSMHQRRVHMILTY